MITGSWEAEMEDVVQGSAGRGDKWRGTGLALVTPQPLKTHPRSVKEKQT